MPYRDTEEETSILVVGLNGVVVGLEKLSGKLLWKNELKGGGLGRVALTILGGRVLVSSEGDKLFCLDYLTGSTIWEAKTSHHGSDHVILVQGEQIFISKMGYIDCFSWEGARLWSQSLPGLGIGKATLKLPG